MIRKNVRCKKDVDMGNHIAFTIGETYQAEIFDDSIQAINNDLKMHVIKANTIEDFFTEHFEIIEDFNIDDKVKIKNRMLKGIIVEIQKSMKGRKIYVVQINENTSNGYWEEELEKIS